MTVTGTTASRADGNQTIVPLPAPLLAASLSERWGLGQTYAVAGVALGVTAVCMLSFRTWTSETRGTVKAQADVWIDNAKEGKPFLQLAKGEEQARVALADVGLDPAEVERSLAVSAHRRPPCT